MSTAQHTPGPWVYHAKTASIQPYPGSGTICTLSQRDELEANARLIAAAPDLLAALIEAKDRLSDDGEYPFTLRIVCDAIAKAKGAQS